MEEFYAITEQPYLFQAEAEVAEEAVQHLNIPAARGAETDIATILRGKSHVSIGDPIALPLNALLIRRHEEVDADIQLQLQEYEFYAVQLACSFTAAEGCRFRDAEFTVELYNPEISAAGSTQEGPIAYTLAPLSVEDETKISRKFSFNPNLTFKFGPAQTQVGGIIPGAEQSTDYIIYRNRIEAFGLRWRKAGWKFRRTKQHGISSPQELFMVIRKPTGTRVAAKFGLSARIEAITQLGPIGPLSLNIFFHGKGSVADEPQKLLC
jgi:hypothetical protein